jgi:hypothetical protein
MVNVFVRHRIKTTQSGNKYSPASWRSDAREANEPIRSRVSWRPRQLVPFLRVGYRGERRTLYCVG